MKLPKDFAELLELLNAKGVKGLIVGGYAFCYEAVGRLQDLADVAILRRSCRYGRKSD
jgi:hypothetical protein